MHADGATKQAEKDYLRRSGSRLWEEVKPFSPAGTQTLGESLRLIHDFAVAAYALDLRPGHRVLDLGVGAGWTTEWLRRLNVDVVAVDIAHDMLAVGQRRIPAPPFLVTGDLEALPFGAGTFDRALCLNALHHIPDPAAALRQIHGVLNDRGRLVLIEPGAGHAQQETSRTAVQQFGVLERDLHAEDLMRLCREAGFVDVVVRPLSYMSSEIQLSIDQLTRWNQWTRQTRPVRVLRKLWLLVQELAGAAKQGALFEESLGMWVSRVLARHMSEQGVVVASKSSSAESAPYAADLQVVASAAREATHRLTVQCRNAGTSPWYAEGKHRVQVGVQLLDESRRIVNRDYARSPISSDVMPRQQCLVECEMPRPARGSVLRVDLVVEGLTWLDTAAPDGVVVTVED